MKTVSKFQSAFKSRLLEILKPHNFSLLSEDLNPSETTIEFPNGTKHIVDFFIPEINLFIELSGQNYLPKLLKMKRAHKLKGINYYAFIEIANKELAVPSIESQVSEFVHSLEEKESAEQMSSQSEAKLDAIFARFSQLYLSVT